MGLTRSSAYKRLNPRRPFVAKRQFSWLPNNDRKLKITIRSARVRGDMHAATRGAWGFELSQSAQSISSKSEKR